MKTTLYLFDLATLRNHRLIAAILIPSASCITLVFSIGYNWSVITLLQLRLVVSSFAWSTRYSRVISKLYVSWCPWLYNVSEITGVFWITLLPNSWSNFTLIHVNFGINSVNCATQDAVKRWLQILLPSRYKLVFELSGFGQTRRTHYCFDAAGYSP